MTDDEIIGVKRRFKAAMKEAGITRKRMAEEVGASTRAVWDIYSEKKRSAGLYFPQVTIHALRVLALHGIDTNQILTGEGEGND